MAEILTLDGISYAYPFTSSGPVLEKVDMTVEPGDVVCIAGRNGSGKSTLAQLAAGLITPSDGVIYYGGDSIRTRRGIQKLRENVGLLFQAPEEQLFSDTVFQDISFGPRNRGERGQELRSTVQQSCELAGLDLERLGTRSPFSLSQGEKRMVALAGLFALKPEVLILDEPFNGLDYENKSHILDSLIMYRNSREASLVIITHELSSVWPFASRFGFLSGGELPGLNNKEDAVSAVGGLSNLGLRLPQWGVLGHELERLGIRVSDPSDCRQIADAILSHIGGRDVKR